MSRIDATTSSAPASWRDLSLQDGGRSLVEASAGTGKTWTISVLYLRLLLERELDPTRIVVTTFSEATAQELRERIRARVVWATRQARDVLGGTRTVATAPGETDGDWLRDRWNAGAAADCARIEADLNRLRLAEAELDRAPIGTLHALCRKILADFPFDSGVAFDLGELIPNEALQAELADDLWRRLGQSPHELREGDQAWWSGGRRALDAVLRKALMPGVSVAVPAQAPIDELLQPDTARLLREWLGDGAQFVRSNSALRNRLAKLAEFIETGGSAGEPPRDLAAVLAEPLANHLRPAAIADGSHRAVLALAARAASVLPMIADAPRARALQRYCAELRQACRQRLAATERFTFDELIERVHRALHEEGGTLAGRLFEAWPVAMVDEFQDTDRLQYGILDRIYRADDGRHRGRLVMIGDPKQAIYRFRGGDIDAYLAAREDADSRLSLDTNFRSSSELVAAYNALYAAAGTRLSSRPDHPIVYEAVRPGGQRDAQSYRVGADTCMRPLQIHYRAEGVADDAESRQSSALEACANHIVDLLGPHRAGIGARPLQPGDIAVLLPRNRHVARLRELLRQRNVPCVASARSSVFASDWARELQIVLHAVLHARDEGAMRAALATRLGGCTYDELRALRGDPDAWQAVAARFDALAAQWRERGVLAVVQALTGEAAVRLFAAGDGERALTDLRHLGELLQARSAELAGPGQLLTWMAEQRDDGSGDAGDAADSMQLRIESDAARVRVMTLHASKGLEFPVVMLPLMWADRHSGSDAVAVVHDPASGQRMIAFGAEATGRYRQEGQDERFRLLYVALTRARYACHVYALPPDRPLKAGARKADADPLRAPLDAMLERLLENGDPARRLGDNILWSTAGWPWNDAKLAVDGAPETLPRVVLPAPLARPFESMYSFSALTQARGVIPVDEPAAADEPEGDAGGDGPRATAHGPPGEEAHAPLSGLAGVAGTEFGNALHAVFERREIGRPLAEQHRLVRDCLSDHGVRPRDLALDELVPLVAARVQATLDTPLLPATAPALSLGRLPAASMRAEMEFHFVLGEVSMHRLRSACSDHGEPHLVPRTPARVLRGLMNGKIDLVFEHAGRFHVLDYKSNRLGDRLSDYAPARLARAMDEHHYRFQALLYTVAVDRYLRQRMPRYRRDTDLGEAIYLFVRATGMASGLGIWAHRFDDALIAAVERVFADPAHAEVA